MPTAQLDDTLLLIELETAKKYEAELAAQAVLWKLLVLERDLTIADVKKESDSDTRIC